jgi:hypothetical protein
LARRSPSGDEACGTLDAAAVGSVMADSLVTPVRPDESASLSRIVDVRLTS